ncbi:hypothetical protein SNEBB_011019 [Seison nebaliae]|nr:hypothetical protein SNEBB_011019 [Seison nebaliae]
MSSFYDYEKFVEECEELSDVWRQWKLEEVKVANEEKKCFLSYKEMKESNDELFQLIIHVCFDESYRVPTAYFRMMTLSGELKDWRESMKLINSHFGNLREIISEKHHPLMTNHPLYLHIHPCETTSYLRRLVGKMSVWNWMGTYLQILSISPPDTIGRYFYEKNDGIA